MESTAKSEVISECIKNKGKIANKAIIDGSTDEQVQNDGGLRKRSFENNFKIRSPQKRPRLEITTKTTNNKYSAKFKYGNYDRYYGYRNTQNFTDIRLDAFKNHIEFFKGKEILDIGCNNGFITTAIARDFEPTLITGIDIDKKLIARAIKVLNNEKNAISSNETASESVVTNYMAYPHNVIFKYGNYVLSNPILLKLDEAKFDTILCLSVTKWIHLNNGDDGIKITFKRMFKQLRPGGLLILEAQNWKSYKRRKKLTDDIFEHFKNIKLFPNKFDEYLLSSEVGFERFYTIDMTKEHLSQGFQRPIKVFVKPTNNDPLSSTNEITEPLDDHNNSIND